MRVEILKTILIVLGVLLAGAGFYLYIKHLFEEGYDEDEIYLHIFRNVPLRHLKKDNDFEDYYEKYGYQSRPKEYENVDPDSYPSAYGWNCDPEVIELMNAAPVDRKHNEQLLSDGGWQCTCGRANARYVSTCACGQSKDGNPKPEPAPAIPMEESVDETVAAIREYKKLLDEGILTPEEFEAKKKQLLGI